METTLADDEKQLYLHPNTECTISLPEGHVNVIFKVRNIVKLFYWACQNSRIDLVKDIFDNFTPPTMEDVKRYFGYYKEYNLEILKYLDNKLNLPLCYTSSVLERACACGDLDAVKYFFTRYELNKADAIKYVVNASKNEQMGVLDFIVKGLDVIADDFIWIANTIIFGGETLFETSSFKKSVKYFVDSDRWENKETALKYCCIHGLVPQIEHLVKRFNLTVEDFTREADTSRHAPLATLNISAFNCACKHGQLDAVKYIVENFNIDIKNLRENFCKTLRISLKDVFEYLILKFDAIDDYRKSNESIRKLQNTEPFPYIPEIRHPYNLL
jgi:cell division protein ZapA (FtsZ GTPase activity inhibitor)